MQQCGWPRRQWDLWQQHWSWQLWMQQIHIVNPCKSLIISLVELSNSEITSVVVFISQLVIIDDRSGWFCNVSKLSLIVHIQNDKHISACIFTWSNGCLRFLLRNAGQIYTLITNLLAMVTMSQSMWSVLMGHTVHQKCYILHQRT